MQPRKVSFWHLVDFGAKRAFLMWAKSTAVHLGGALEWGTDEKSNNGCPNCLTSFSSDPGRDILLYLWICRVWLTAQPGNQFQTSGNNISISYIYRMYPRSPPSTKPASTYLRVGLPRHFHLMLKNSAKRSWFEVLGKKKQESVYKTGQYNSSRRNNEELFDTNSYTKLLPQ